MSKIKGFIAEHFILVLIVGLVLAGGTFGYLKNYDTEVVTVTVTDRERVTTSESSYYLVYTDSETFTVSDTIWHLRYDSSDFYGSLKRGQKIQVQVCGWRVPFLSMYRNMLFIR